MRDDILAIPKIVLHLHLDGSLDLDLAYKWLMEKGYNYTFDEVKKMMQVDKDCKSLNDYLDKFALPLSLLQTKEHLELATYKLIKKLKEAGVVYFEIRFAPIKHLDDGLSLDEVVEAVLRGRARALEDFNIYGGIILCCMRDSNTNDNLKIVDLTLKYLNNGVVGLDLAGAETLYKTEDFKDIFMYAKKLKIPFTIHAGEAAGVDSINKALDFGAKRLGHGVRCIYDNKTLERIKNMKILLEVCVTSNYQTLAVKGDHPIEALYKDGVNISINTDNDTVSNIDIISEYKRILKETSLSLEDLKKCNYNSIPYLFASDEIKDRIREFFN